MFNKVLDFLFGKEPEIFDQNGKVQHNLPKEKWDAWHQRYMGGEDYNWRNHTGTRAGASKETKDSPRPKS